MSDAVVYIANTEGNGALGVCPKEHGERDLPPAALPTAPMRHEFFASTMAL